jgi:hypothetical protein
MTVLIAKDIVREPLYVVIPVSNPWRWKSRYKRTDRAIKHFMDAGAVVVLVEVAFNRREFVYADSGLDGTPANCGILGQDHRFRHKYIGLRSASELWLKEAQICAAVQQLPYDWEQMAFVDSDVMFLRPNFVGECIQQLQHYSWLQMFSHAQDLTPEYEVMPHGYPHATGLGYVQAWKNDLLDAFIAKDKMQERADPYYPSRVWPGVAWACSRYGWDAVGGLMPFHIWGGCDWVTAHALVGDPQRMMRTDLHPVYQQMVMEWFDKAERHIRRNVGVMTGTIVHNFHGLKPLRAYDKKHALLAKIGFNPQRHLKNDSQGLPILNDDGSDAYIILRDAMRQIAKERNEDTNDLRMDIYMSESEI